MRARSRRRDAPDRDRRGRSAARTRLGRWWRRETTPPHVHDKWFEDIESDELAG